jgi:hypothetical protein
MDEAVLDNYLATKAVTIALLFCIETDTSTTEADSR